MSQNITVAFDDSDPLSVYLWPSMVTNSENMRVVVTGIASTVPTGTQPPEWNLVMAAAMMALLPPVLVVILLQRWFVHGLIEPEK